MKHLIFNIVSFIVLVSLLFFDYTFSISWVYFVLLGIIYLSVIAWAASSISSGFFIEAVCKASGKSNAVAITFDDGPFPGATERILAILKQYGVESAFFCVGKRVVENPEIVKEIHLQNHIIGNHSYSHGKFFDMQLSSKMSAELKLMNSSVEKIIDRQPMFFRPPYGVTNPNLAKAIKKGNFSTIGWSLRSFDTMTDDKDELLKRVKKKLKPGDIILFHDYSEAMISALPQIIEHIREVGLEIVRLDHLVDKKAYA